MSRYQFYQQALRGFQKIESNWEKDLRKPLLTEQEVAEVTLQFIDCRRLFYGNPAKIDYPKLIKEIQSLECLLVQAEVKYWTIFYQCQ
jgi:hypothetical protein